MKKYQLGTLTVKDRELQGTKEEIVIELIDRMQKYVAEGKAAYENGEYTEKQKLNIITNLAGRFCGLSEFLSLTMKIDIAGPDGVLLTNKLYGWFFYWEQQLRIEISRQEGATTGRGKEDKNER